jgi:prolyl oligopeptidase
VLGAFAANGLELRGLDGALLHTVSLPGVGVLSDHYGDDPVTGAPDQPFAYYKFSSPIVPRQIFRLEVKTGASTLIDEVKPPFDSARVEVETAWYPSKDGTPISMYLVHRKGQARDGTTPYLLAGYGGFNIPMSPIFNAAMLPWIEQGGGFAVAQMRGGGEYGEAWHQAGMGTRKQNVFDDFIGAAEYLIRERYTASAHLAIRGGSNGGLLVGAAMTQRPELFGAVICAVPLLDMIRYHRFGEGKTWVPEYGSAETAEGFASIFAYSPYHHVTAGTHYPPLLMLSADADDRVDPLHARKFVALVQARGAPGTVALLRIEKHAGHGGADRVLQTLEQTADMDAFLLQHLR